MTHVVRDDSSMLSLDYVRLVGTQVIKPQSSTVKSKKIYLSTWEIEGENLPRMEIPVVDDYYNNAKFARKINELNPKQRQMVINRFQSSQEIGRIPSITSIISLIQGW